MSAEPPTTTANIADTLQEHAVPIDVPIPHPNNPRRGDVKVIAESLARFGQVRPIVVQKSTAYVIAGNHTLRAAKDELGWSHIAAIAVDLDDDEAQAYLVADNRIPDLGTYDEAVMAPILESMMLAGKLTGTGWTPDNVDDMLAAMDALPETTPEGEFEGEHGITDEALKARFANRSQGGALRQFVLLYEQEVGTEIEGMLTRLARAWGMSGARDVVLESLRRAVAVPPVEGLSDEEQARADAPPEEPEAPAAAPDAGAPDPGENLEAATGSDSKAAPEGERQPSPLEQSGIVDPPAGEE